jgi:hypothetical protein
VRREDENRLMADLGVGNPGSTRSIRWGVFNPGRSPRADTQEIKGCRAGFRIPGT